MGGTPLNARVVDITPTPDGHGYWLVAADGGVFSFGDASFFGSMGATRLNAPIVGIAPTADGKGYWLVAADGGIFSFGDATFHGSTGATPPAANTPVAAMAAKTGGSGYWFTTTGKTLPPSAAVPSVLDQCDIPGAPPAIEPSSIVLACGDGNARLANLTWSSWTPTSAIAIGDYVHNTCTPDCAQGTFVSAPASIRLAYPVLTSAGEEFASVSYTYANPSSPGGISAVAALIATSPG